ncbi:MAG: class I SAM-dependent methyltransferase [Pirellulaceae bacterium]
MNELDDPSRGSKLAEIILRKPALRNLYLEVYQRYARVLAQCPSDGLAIELGAGAGFAKQVIPELVTADVLPYSTVEIVFDACRMPFDDNSLRFVCMLNVFHHIADIPTFLRECRRCLKPGGRMLIVDQFPGWISHWVLQYFHHEPYNPASQEWGFASSGPLSGANGALAWIVFIRDRELFEQRFPELRIVDITSHTPLRYWASGGLKWWSMIPGPCWKMACLVDATLIRCSSKFGSFMDIELEKTSDSDGLS